MTNSITNMQPVTPTARDVVIGELWGNTNYPGWAYMVMSAGGRYHIASLSSGAMWGGSAGHNSSELLSILSHPSWYRLDSVTVRSQRSKETA